MNGGWDYYIVFLFFSYGGFLNWGTPEIYGLMGHPIEMDDDWGYPPGNLHVVGYPIENWDGI